MSVRHLDISILTFNTWALPISIPTHAKRERLARLPGALRDVDADIVVLQELFDVRGRRQVVASLADTYHAAPGSLDTRRVMGLSFDRQGGVLVLSKYPIERVEFVPHPLPSGSKLTERLGQKGTVFARLATPLGAIALVAPHLYAGTARADTAIRMRQVDALSHRLRQSDGELLTVVSGDLNCPPTSYDDGSPSELDVFRAAGFEDSIHREDVYTWSASTNPYTRALGQQTKTDMRFDYVLYRAGTAGVSIGKAGTVFDRGDEILSDHFGIHATLRVQAGFASVQAGGYD